MNSRLNGEVVFMVALSLTIVIVGLISCWSDTGERKLWCKLVRTDKTLFYLPHLLLPSLRGCLCVDLLTL